MKINLNVEMTEAKITIHFSNDQGVIEVYNTNRKEFFFKKPTVYLLYKDNLAIYIGKSNQAVAHDNIDFDKAILITPPWEYETKYLEQILLDEAKKNGLILLNPSMEKVKIPLNQKKIFTIYINEILFVLKQFGYDIKPKGKTEEIKVKSTKVQHKWNKSINKLEFFINSRESKGTVIWQKRNEVLLKAGAELKPIPSLNKDGSLGISAKMGEKLRSDNATKIDNFKTKEDLIFKSVNEVGLFLYFGGTNSWLELVDINGKTIDEWAQ